MQKLVLIDGNSLLNRAFYATKLLTTKDGTPTNAVYGFVKLLLKVIADIQPDRLILTFDRKAPTFRHKLYDGYKATRKPMPNDLAVQVEILKELLRSMRFTLCEKDGFEADDLIGTLSHCFDDTKSIIITGDRDAYQLVDSKTDVYITKTGVSELLKLTIENFQETVGYAPDRVVDLKALMGDSSDNIPGVPGVGEKTALDLIRRYESLDDLYSHLDDIAPKIRAKLEAGKQSAYLSRTLATIDRNVPLDLPENAGRIYATYPAEVRTQFQQLEFTSLLKMDIFEELARPCSAVESQVEKILVTDVANFLQEFSVFPVFSAVFFADNLHFYANNTEFILPQQKTLLDVGLSESQMAYVLQEIFSDENKKAILYGKKDFRHRLRRYNVFLHSSAEDVSLIKYLVDYTGKEDDLSFVLQSSGLNIDFPACGVFCLYNQLLAKLQTEHMERLYRDLELPLSDVLYDMECCGVKVDTKTSYILEQRYRKKIAEITAEIYQQAGEQFNLNSPAQLGKILFEKMGLPSPKKGKRGYSTSADILEKYAADYPVVRNVLDCRHYQKLLSTYIDGFKPLIHPETGLVHTSFNQIQTATGRLSSANPNLQNIPVRDEEGRELRKLFVARSPDRVLIDADYSQIELRLLAHFSGCKELIEAYRQGKDIHTLTASQVFGVSLEDVTPAQRRAAKAVNFGIIYGISDFGLASNLNISPKQAGEYIKKYFETYSDVKKYMDSNVAFAKKNGFITTLLGRKRMIPEILSSNFNIRSFGERAAMNMPLQGSSADIIKLAMIRLTEHLRKDGFRAQLILQVHDELVIDAPMSEQEEVAQILKSEMENAVTLQVPLVAEIHFGKNWYEAK